MDCAMVLCLSSHHLLLLIYILLNFCLIKSFYLELNAEIDLQERNRKYKRIGLIEVTWSTFSWCKCESGSAEYT